ncbi:MAG: hypothetical protein NTX50_21490 [Candidatus Sumerlaeota bacterium]|nr:hypothetical protein [Candidatus Sumerlaeota bacterium]
MKRDIAIEEIRAVRHQISEQFDHDTSAFLNYYRGMEKNYKERMLKEANDKSKKQLHKRAAHLAE